MRCASLLETVTEKSATPVLLAAIKGKRTMKYICLGYYDGKQLDHIFKLSGDKIASLEIPS